MNNQLYDVDTARQGGYTLRRRREQLQANVDQVDGGGRSQRLRHKSNTQQSWNQVLTGVNEISRNLKPWRRDLWLIEGKCGTAVTTYFIFLRRLILLNLIISTITLCCYLVPQYVISGSKSQGKCNFPVSSSESGIFQQIMLFFSGQGVLENSTLFYGAYKTSELISIIYLCGTMLIFMVSLIFVSVIAGKSIFKSIVGKSTKQIFKYSRLTLASWDFHISNASSKKTHQARLAENIRNELIEDRLVQERMTWTFLQTVWITFIRVLTTIGNLTILTLSVAAVALAATSGKKLKHENAFINFVYSYLISIALAGTSTIAPWIFQALIRLQKQTREIETNQLLGWRVALRFLSLITLFVCLVGDAYSCNGDLLSSIGGAKNITDKILSTMENKFDFESQFSSNLTNTKAFCERPVCVCWPVVLGQEMFKLTFGWLIGQLGTILGALLMKMVRSWIKINSRDNAEWGCCSTCFLGLFENFDLTDNVLKIVSWQTVCWLACFYCPMLPLVVLVRDFD